MLGRLYHDEIMLTVTTVQTSRTKLMPRSPSMNPRVVKPAVQDFSIARPEDIVLTLAKPLWRVDTEMRPHARLSPQIATKSAWTFHEQFTGMKGAYATTAGGPDVLKSNSLTLEEILVSRQRETHRAVKAQCSTKSLCCATYDPGDHAPPLLSLYDG